MVERGGMMHSPTLLLLQEGSDRWYEKECQTWNDVQSHL